MSETYRDMDGAGTFAPGVHYTQSRELWLSVVSATDGYQRRQEALLAPHASGSPFCPRHAGLFDTRLPCWWWWRRAKPGGPLRSTSLWPVPQCAPWGGHKEVEGSLST